MSDAIFFCQHCCSRPLILRRPFSFCTESIGLASQNLELSMNRGLNMPLRTYQAYQACRCLEHGRFQNFVFGDQESRNRNASTRPLTSERPHPPVRLKTGILLAPYLEIGRRQIIETKLSQPDGPNSGLSDGPQNILMQPKLTTKIQKQTSTRCLVSRQLKKSKKL